MREHIKKMEVPRCLRDTCQGLVKPDIVFFGEQLPAKFFEERATPTMADLCIVLGTSLTVQPFASLPSVVEGDTPRVLINLERVGGLGSRSDDVLVLGDCDAGVRKIAKACGWLDELEKEWSLTAREASKEEADDEVPGPPKNRDEMLEAEVDKLTREVDETLKISSDHIERMKAEHGEKSVQADREKGETCAEQRLTEKLSGSHRSGEEFHANGKPEDDLARKVKQDVFVSSEGNGLDHVYPHIKKPSL
jgi:NAD+-dependent protein deacetylase SIR2